jgi:hypothetical protein
VRLPSSLVSFSLVHTDSVTAAGALLYKATLPAVRWAASEGGGALLRAAVAQALGQAGAGAGAVRGVVFLDGSGQTPSHAALAAQAGRDEAWED